MSASLVLEFLKIVGFSVFCAVLYGILHDQITAHMAVEYFTIAHPRVFPTTDPFWLAIGWGIIATWWVGMTLGLLLATCARLGGWQTVSLSELRRPILVLMLISGISALIAGSLGWFLTENGTSGTIGLWEHELHPDRHSRFAFAAWAHFASYLAGSIGGLAIAAHTILKRRAMAQTASTSSTYSG